MSAIANENMESQAEPQPLPNGPAAAAILAGGIGTGVYGVVVTLAENVKSIGNALNWYKPVGNLTGKTGLSVIIMFVVWAIIGKAWKGKNVNLDKLWKISLALIVLGLLLTFPLVFDAF